MARAISYSTASSASSGCFCFDTPSTTPSNTPSNSSSDYSPSDTPSNSSSDCNSSDTPSGSSSDDSASHTPSSSTSADEVSWESDGESLSDFGCHCLCPANSCSHQFSMLPHSPPGPINDAPYFIAPDTIQARRSSKRAKSPLSGLQPVANIPLRHDEDAEYDYGNTARWGVVILICTWLLAVIGLGSCFGVWSWAWYGNKPRPMIEDLPIEGYYLCLIILSCVMAWVWITTAWMGMKYFRHARAN